MGLVFVLLLGEIDLSAGYTAGVAGADHGRRCHPARLAVVGRRSLVCLATGAVIGLVIGLLVARLGIPSFVVTLAAFLGLQGLLLAASSARAARSRSRDNTILAIMNKNLPIWLGWALYVVVIARLRRCVTYRQMATRRAAGTWRRSRRPCGRSRSSAWPSCSALCTYYLSIERSRNPALTSIKGVPDRHPRADRAARGADLPAHPHRRSGGTSTRSAATPRRPAAPASTCPASSCSASSSARRSPAVAGILLASRVNSVDARRPAAATTLLYAVGAAVIGGTSLFGGKGRRRRVIGGLVVAVIANGMGLLNQSAAVVYMVTGLVLLLAAGVDALSRRRAAATGES